MNIRCSLDWVLSVSLMRDPLCAFPANRNEKYIGMLVLPIPSSLGLPPLFPHPFSPITRFPFPHLTYQSALALMLHRRTTGYGTLILLTSRTLGHLAASSWRKSLYPPMFFVHFWGVPSGACGCLSFRFLGDEYECIIKIANSHKAMLACSNSGSALPGKEYLFL